MNAQTYLAQLAQKSGGTWVPKCTTFKEGGTVNIKGAVIGARAGYLVGLALTRTGRNSSFAILVRFPATTAVAQLQEAIKSKPGFSSFFAKKRVKVTANSLVVSWVYSLKKPAPEEILSLLDSLLQEISRYVPAFAGKCEDCNAAETREITLMNGIPGYHCAACQMRVTAEKRREEEEYKARDANYFLAILAGILAAALVGTVWGEFANIFEVSSDKWYPSLHSFVTVFLGGAVSWVLFKAAGKRDRAGQVAAVLLTLAAKWWGDTLYYSHVIAYVRAIPWQWPLVVYVVKHFFDFKLAGGLSVMVFIADLGFSAMIPWSPWGRIPKFEPVFQTINPDGSLSRTIPAGVGV